MFDWLRFWKKRVEVVQYYWDHRPYQEDQNVSDTRSNGVSGQIKWEINISKKGKHVFATDRTIRTYTEGHIRDLILIFREKFPEAEDYKITITGVDLRTVTIPETIAAALIGDFVKCKSDKYDKLLDSCLQSNSYINDEALPEGNE